MAAALAGGGGGASWGLCLAVNRVGPSGGHRGHRLTWRDAAERQKWSQGGNCARNRASWLASASGTLALR